MLHVELGREFRLPAVLQPVRRFVQQGADQLAIAAVALAAEADAVVGWCVEALQAIRAVVQHQHTGMTGGFDLRDQARVMGPAEAIAAGASQLVIGRPITKADDPSAAFAACCAELMG